MEKNNLPTDELKEYGIINEDNSFSKKLSGKDVKNFLNGYVIVADNDKDRITFQLTDNNSRLNVRTFQRDKSIDNILKDSKIEIQYSKIEEIQNPKKEKERDYNVKVFAAQKDEDSNKIKSVKELDLFKDIKEITKIVAETNEIQEVNRYKVELQKLMSFIQDKIDKYPELGKQLTENLNIVHNEVNSVNSISEELNKNQEKTKIEYDVNDPDLYQDAKRKQELREEEEEVGRKSRRR